MFMLIKIYIKLQNTNLGIKCANKNITLTRNKILDDLYFHNFFYMFRNTFLKYI